MATDRVTRRRRARRESQPALSSLSLCTPAAAPLQLEQQKQKQQDARSAHSLGLDWIGLDWTRLNSTRHDMTRLDSISEVSKQRPLLRAKNADPTFISGTMAKGEQRGLSGQDTRGIIINRT